MSDILAPAYDNLFHEIKERIRSARTRASLAVNRELVLLLPFRR